MVTPRMNNPFTSPSSLKENARELGPPGRLQVGDSHSEVRTEERTEGRIEGSAEGHAEGHAEGNIEDGVEVHIEGHAEEPYQKPSYCSIERLAGRNKS
jgi:hypothetical protein